MDRDDLALLDALDALEVGLAFYDAEGAPLLRTRAFERLLESFPPFTELDRALEHVVLSLLGAPGINGNGASHAEPVARLEVRACDRTCILTATRLPSSAGARVGAIVVRLEVDPGTELSEHELRIAYGLTRREVQIARMVASGRTDEQLANELCISYHTAHNHVRAVLAKLGVNRRALVPARLTRAKR